MSYDEPKSEERRYNTKPPIPEEFLIRVYKRWRMKHSSQHIPHEYLAAAHWWIDMQEVASHAEQPTAGSDSKGNQFWTTPYIDRVVVNFRKFLSLDETHKSFVIQKIREGVPYRGDDMDMFMLICREEEKMAADKSGYIESALDALKNFSMTGVRL